MQKENVHNVLCMVKKWQETSSKGWSQLAQEYPLSLDDMCTFDLVKPTEFALLFDEQVRKMCELLKATKTDVCVSH
ncbi:hypothetical protein YC2023_043985 [Brassica napus]